MNTEIDEIGDNHFGTAGDTPLRSNAFELTDDKSYTKTSS